LLRAFCFSPFAPDHSLDRNKTKIRRGFSVLALTVKAASKKAAEADFAENAP